MVVRPQPNLCANTSRRRAILPANPPGRGLATALCFVIGRRNRYRGLHEQANPDNSKTTPHIFGYRFFEVEVSRKNRWGEDLGGPKTSFFPTFLRAGFEPRRGRPTSLHFEATRTDDTLDEATPTHGSNPARLRHGW